MNTKMFNTIFFIIITILIVSSFSKGKEHLVNTTSDNNEIVLIDEGFENKFPPSNWSNFGWIDSYYGGPHNGSHWAYSWSKGDILTTPDILFHSDTKLRFWYAAESSSRPMSLSVLIDDSIRIWSDVNFVHTNYKEAIIDLQSYTGFHTISFLGNTSDFYGQLLDDILVTTIQDINYDVNNDGAVNYQDAGIVWIHRSSIAPYDNKYDMNSDGSVNFQDAGIVWINRS